MGHCGVSKTLDMVMEHIFQPHMRKTVEKVCSSCIMCKQAKSKELHNDLSMDFILGLPRTKKGRDSIFVVVDRLHGVPCTIISDMDVKFVGHFWKVLWGKIEFAYNRSIHTTTSYSPFEVVYGFSTLTTFDLVPLSLDHISSIDGEKKADLLKSIHAEVKQRMEKTYETIAKKINKGWRQVIFDPGDWVWVHLRKERFPNQWKCKLDPRGDGPFQVIERINDKSYRIDLPGKFCVVYFDDILIYSKTLQDHVEHLRSVLQTLREERLFRNIEKCVFFTDKLTFFGYIVSFQEWPRLTTISQVRSFHGLASFYHRFVPHFSSITVPLIGIIKKNLVFSLGKEQEDAFLKIKDCLTKGSVLALPDFNKMFEIECDASGVGIGAGMSQKR
ncbi:hypothetical protein GQ457_04G020450 [Hibiscus cannabinus]